MHIQAESRKIQKACETFKGYSSIHINGLKSFNLIQKNTGFHIQRKEGF